MDEQNKIVNNFLEKTPVVTPSLITYQKPPSLQQPSVSAPTGFYVIAYKLAGEINGKNYFTVTDHTDIDKFMVSRLKFGQQSKDVKIVEKADTYLDAVSIATVLTLEENFNDGYEKKGFGGLIWRWDNILRAKYTLKEIFTSSTPIKKYP